MSAITEQLAWLAEHPQYVEGAYSVAMDALGIRIQGKVEDTRAARRRIAHDADSIRFESHGAGTDMHEWLKAEFGDITVVHIVILKGAAAGGETS